MSDFEDYHLLVNGIKPVDKVKNKRKKSEKKVLTKVQKTKLLRNKHAIKCHSKTSVVPDPIINFSDLVSRYQLNSNFLKCFESLEYSKPTAVQMQSIPVMLERHHTLTLAPTGSGKTAAFLIPILHHIVNNKKPETTTCAPRALILSPTIELAKQTYHECICLVKELSEDDKPKIVFCCKENKNDKHWNKMMKAADILICTPMRLKRLIKLKEDVSFVTLENLMWLVIDESDKMLEDSIHSFANQFKDIHAACLQSSDFRVAMFSATQSADVWSWAKENLSEDLVYVRVGAANAAVDTITQELRYCVNEQSKLTEMKSLLAAGKLKCPCLIFLDKADSAFHLNKLLEDDGRHHHINISVISGDFSDAKRRDLITDFREGKIHFLICTNLLARGMDFKGVETVVNYDLPKLKEEYIHRIGRCGRAGRSGSAISLWTDVDIANGLLDVLKVMEASGQSVNQELMALVQKRAKAAPNKGDSLLKKLKRKYQAEDGSHGDIVRFTDKKKKMYLEKCVVRNKFLKKSYANSLQTPQE